MKQDRAIEYTQVMSTLHLAVAWHNDTTYVRQVAKRLAKGVRNKDTRKLLRSIATTGMPCAVVRKFIYDMELTYKAHGQDWRKLNEY